ncbi:MAG: ATP-binding protein [Nitrospirae bacterium]|nr:ATP-binding protein [Nitrospirota bacterium]
MKKLRSSVEPNYREPLLRYVVFRIDTADNEHSLITRKRLLFLTFFALTAVASASVIERFVISSAVDLFIVDAPKHATIEIFCGLISGIIAFILAWEYLVSAKKNILFLVFAFFSLGTLDIFHAFSNYNHNAFVWFHSCGSFLGSACLAGSVYLNGKIEEPGKSAWAHRSYMVAGMFMIVLFALLSIKLDYFIPSVLHDKLPYKTSVISVKGYFSSFIYAMNFISSLLYLFAGVVFLKGFTKTHDVMYLIFGTAACLFFESAFLFGFSKLWDPLWWYWHIIKVMVFSGLLVGLAYGFTHTVYRLYGSKIKLAKFLEEIEVKNIELRDAYERLKETQRYLKESEKLASMGRMAAMVAHEIRNPLGAISNSLGVLKRYSSLEKDDLELIEIVEKEMERLNKIAEDFLSFSRPSRLKREATDIHGLIDETVALLQIDTEGPAGVKICRSFMQGLPSLVIDRHRVKQILLNVIINALQSMQSGGELTITTQYKEAEDEIDLTIADTGIGMPEAVLSQVFQPFFTTKDSGLGLGLNIVHKIMKEHGGYVLISSTEGKGTHIQLNFPVVAENERAPGAEDASAVVRSGRDGE